jgi:hypothetical protein
MEYIEKCEGLFRPMKVKVGLRMTDISYTLSSYFQIKMIIK